MLQRDQARAAGDALAGARRRASSGCSPRSRSARWRRSAPGKYTDRVLTVLSMVGVSMPPFFLGACSSTSSATRRASSRSAATCRITHEPVAVVLPPDRAVVHALGAVHRLLLARAALLDPRHDERGLRAHRARQGAVRAPGARQARAAHQPAADHLAVGARPRAGDRRRRDPDRDRLQPARRRPARRAVDRQLRHRHAALRS